MKKLLICSIIYCLLFLPNAVLAGPTCQYYDFLRVQIGNKHYLGIGYVKRSKKFAQCATITEGRTPLSPCIDQFIRFLRKDYGINSDNIAFRQVIDFTDPSKAQQMFDGFSTEIERSGSDKAIHTGFQCKDEQLDD